jgi:phosphoenolpyruvate carboxylase
MVMIGYSDSAKDAGVMAASWAQYQAQDALIKTCEKAGIELTLFHGRGGSIGRGGAPARGAALAAAGKPERRPARHRAGRDDPLQIRSAGSDHQQPVALYQRHSGSQPAAAAGAESEWRDIMDELSDISCEMYRGYVRENKDFVPYFRSATPEQELGKLPLGSRPAKRRPTGGVESLRAIPWIFAWTQNRLMLPAWLGAGAALQKWWKTANRANWKPCAATGRSSLPASACWRWSSRKPTCGWRNTTISVW